MALVLKDRVKETSTTTGTGSFTLGGTSTGFQSFSVIGDGNTTYYGIVNPIAGEWEVGIGTYTASGTVLSRDTILESSNGGSAVDFSAGNKDVFVTYPAEKSASLDTLASPPAIGSTTPAAGTFTTLTATGQTSLGGDATNPSLVASAVSGSTRWLQVAGSAVGNVALTLQGIGNPNMQLITRGTGGFTFSTNASSGTQQFAVTHTASAVNYVQVTGAATGNAVYLTSQGSDANIPMVVQSKGTQPLYLASGGGIQFAILNTASAVNYAYAKGGAAGSGATIAVQGSDTNIDLALTTKGTGAVKLNTGSGEQFRVKDNGTTTTDFAFAIGSNFGRPVIGAQTISGSGSASLALTGWGTSGVIQLYTNNTAQEQMRITHTSSAVNYVQVTGAATGSGATISTQGSDANVTMNFVTKGSNGFVFQTRGGGTTKTAFTILDGGSAVTNSITVTPANTGNAPIIASAGSDTNIDLAMTPKGTGNVRFGTYTGTALSIAGYIEIKTADGVVRKLAVVA